MSQVYPQVAYALSQPLLTAYPLPIIANRAPTVNDKAQLGQLWIWSSINIMWVLSSIIANQAQWLELAVNGDAGDFTTVTATGNIESTGGSVGALDNVSATNGFVSGVQLEATGDLGAGVIATTSFTSGTNNVQGIGTGTVLMTTGNDHNNAGFIKIYVGTTIAYIPYWTVIAP